MSTVNEIKLAVVAASVGMKDAYSESLRLMHANIMEAMEAVVRKAQGNPVHAVELKTDAVNIMKRR
jgi:hypothetical protein